MGPGCLGRGQIVNDMLASPQQLRYDRSRPWLCYFGHLTWDRASTMHLSTRLLVPWSSHNPATIYGNCRQVAPVITRESGLGPGCMVSTAVDGWSFRVGKATLVTIGDHQSTYSYQGPVIGGLQHPRVVNERVDMTPHCIPPSPHPSHPRPPVTSSPIRRQCTSSNGFLTWGFINQANSRGDLRATAPSSLAASRHDFSLNHLNSSVLQSLSAFRLTCRMVYVPTVALIRLFYHHKFMVTKSISL